VGFASKLLMPGGMFTAQVKIPGDDPVRPPMLFGGVTRFFSKK
jgi:hypothetical protein